MRAITYICALAVLALILSACGKGEPPPFITVEHPALPAECLQAPAREPKLPEDRDSDDLIAARDREALKAAFRSERGLRQACAGRLKALFPEEKKP